MAVQIIPTQISITATVLGSILVVINKQCIESNFLGFGHFCTFRKSAQKELWVLGTFSKSAQKACVVREPYVHKLPSRTDSMT